jgi:hypothetical protein
LEAAILKAVSELTFSLAPLFRRLCPQSLRVLLTTHVLCEAVWIVQVNAAHATPVLAVTLSCLRLCK